LVNVGLLNVVCFKLFYYVANDFKRATKKLSLEHYIYGVKEGIRTFPPDISPGLSLHDE